MAAPALPHSCDVLVVGAGPAGSACAAWLAGRGVNVVLADQHEFPRDKVCGDGLIPDAHTALKKLGVYDEVMAHAATMPHVRCIGPSGRHVDVPGTLSVLPRKVLDDLLARHAVKAGAMLATPLRFEAPLLEGEQVVGARFRRGDAQHEISARWVVLATGAVPQAAIAAGLCERHTPSGVALRGYVKHEGLAATISQLQVVWHPRLRGGYGWIFPAPGGLFNIGAGLTGSHLEQEGRGRRAGNVNLREFFKAFQDVHEPARRLMGEGTPVGELKGAPLRCSLEGARWSRPGLLGTGEVLGSTYAFTGEGIGKALETGLLAAQALLAGHREHGHGEHEAATRARYEASLAALKPRFEMYDTASHVNRRPWLADVVVWRANKSPRILRRLSGLLEETQNPGHLLSWRGIGKLMFE